MENNQNNTPNSDETVEEVQTTALFSNDALLTPREVAALFRVSPKTVSRWARSGKLVAITTLGGHRRFRTSQVKSAIEAMTGE